MCMRAYQEDLNRAAKTRKTTGYVIRYKVLTIDRSHLCSPVFPGSRWKAGWKKSNRRSFALQPGETIYYGTYGLNQGIHVYKTLERANVNCCKYEAVVRVKCYNKDLVAEGSGTCEHGAVYQKVFVTRNEYDEAIKALKENRSTSYSW